MLVSWRLSPVSVEAKRTYRALQVCYLQKAAQDLSDRKIKYYLFVEALNRKCLKPEHQQESPFNALCRQVACCIIPYIVCHTEKQ